MITKEVLEAMRERKPVECYTEILDSWQTYYMDAKIPYTDLADREWRVRKTLQTFGMSLRELKAAPATKKIMLKDISKGETSAKIVGCLQDHNTIVFTLQSCGFARKLANFLNSPRLEVKLGLSDMLSEEWWVESL